MKTGKYIATSDDWNVQSRNWKGLSAKLRLALILTLALSVVSCRSKQEAIRNTIWYDSIVNVKTTAIRRDTAIPPRRTKLDVPLEAASSLPEKAVYMAKESGLTLTLERKDSTLHIMAETDSIAPVVSGETVETVTWKTSGSVCEEQASDKVPWWKCIFHVLVGVVVFVLFFGLIRIIL